MVHGTPGSDLAYFLQTVTVDGVRPATAEEILERAEHALSSVILCGHTHLPRVTRLMDGRLIVDPGSIGLPAYDDDLLHPHRMEAGSPYARYAVVERSDEGWSAELVSVVYDWNGAAADAEANGRADHAHALRTGRVSP